MSNNNSNFINVVTDFGADNEGQIDATQALINAFNSIATTGGTVFFPNGTYLIGTNTKDYVEFYSNTHIIGEANVTLLFYRESDDNCSQALLRNHTDASTGGYECTKNCIIENITFDNNSLNDKKATTVGVGHAENIIFKNCRWKNGNGPSSGHIHYIEFNACKDCKLIDCIFEKSKSTNGVQSEMVNIDKAEECSYGDGKYYKYDRTICDNIEIVGCRFYSYNCDEINLDPDIDEFVSPAIGWHSDHTHNAIIIHDCYFEGDWNMPDKNPNDDETPRYAISMLGNLTNCSVYDNIFVSTTENETYGIELTSTNKNNFVYNNKFVNYDSSHILSPVTINNAVCYNNICVESATSEVSVCDNLDKKHKLLWSGMMAKGESQVVSGINDYSIFLVETAYTKTACLAKRDGASVNGGCVYNNNNGEAKVYTMSFHGTVADETLTLTFASRIVHNSSSEHSTIYPDYITAIYGVI